jgi:hypothetical protein
MIILPLFLDQEGSDAEFSCRFCGQKTFSTASFFMAHLASHHSSSEVTYPVLRTLVEILFMVKPQELEVYSFFFNHAIWYGTVGYRYLQNSVA